MVMLVGLGHMFRAIGSYEESYNVAKHLWKVAPQMRGESRTWQLHDAALMPLESENEV